MRLVMLLSDGQANAGVTDPDAVAVAVLTDQGVTTSTDGLGNSFNETLMQAIARACGGQDYCRDTAADLMEPFRAETGLLGDLCQRDLRLSVQAVVGVQATVLNDLPMLDGLRRLPDLACGAEAWAVGRLVVPASMVSAAGSNLPMLRVAVTGLDSAGSPATLECAGLALPVMSAGAAQALTDDELVVCRRVDLAAADAVVQVAHLTPFGDWSQVDQALVQAQVQVLLAGNSWVAASLAAMETLARRRDDARFGQEAAYTSGTLRSRLASKMEPMEWMQAVEEPLYLRRKPRQGEGGRAGMRGAMTPKGPGHRVMPA